MLYKQKRMFDVNFIKILYTISLLKTVEVFLGLSKIVKELY